MKEDNKKCPNCGSDFTCPLDPRGDRGCGSCGTFYDKDGNVIA